MSLRRRLFTLLLVSFVALAASVLGMTRLLDAGAAAQEETAAASGRRAMLALAHHLDEGLTADSPALRQILEDLSRTLEDGAVGVCSVDGEIQAERATARPPWGHGPDDHGPGGPGPDDHGPGGPGGPGDRGPPPDGPGHGRPPEGFGGPGGPHGGRGGPGPGSQGLLPFDREWVTSACRAATGEPQAGKGFAPTDVLLVSTLRARRGTGPVAFALARTPRAARVSTASAGLLSFLGGTAALLLGLTAHGAWVLRASSRSLEGSVRALERDLRAPVSEPEAVELAEVARHLRSLASTLADAQERERGLVLDMEEQRRLAGLGRLVAGVAHEVRNPLAGMKLRLDSIALRPLDGRTRVDVERCLREIGRLDRLVRTMLFLSKDRTVERQRFEAAALVAERISLVTPVAQATDVHVSSDGDAAIDGEREGLAGALDNLLRNAVEASPEGGRVEVHVVEAAGGARIEVVDEGAGVPAAKASALFEPFFTTKASGTGLGLVLARAIVEAHGGRLDYERRDGRTVFSMTIPDGGASESEGAEASDG